MLLMVPVMNLIADEPHQWLYYMNPWDAEWYKGIVENGYQPPKSSGMASWAFFPLYPLVCMAVRLVTMESIDTYAVGMTVSNICIIIAVYYAVKYADIELDMKKYNKKTVEDIIILQDHLPCTMVLCIQKHYSYCVLYSASITLPDIIIWRQE